MRTLTALLCTGTLAGASAGYARSTTEAPNGSPGIAQPARAELAAESGFYLRIEPTRVVSDGKRERLAIASRVGTTKDIGVRTIASVQVEDDRGTIIEPAKVSPRIDLAPSTEVAAGEVAIAALDDGWYRLRGHAVFVDRAKPGEALGSETDSLYLEVRDGEVFVVDMATWFSSSNANQGRAR
jgi:hypothetical protein